MKIEGSIALVTGANRGLGAAFARGLIAPDEVVRQAIAALEAGEPELLVDATTRSVRRGLASDPPVYLGG